MLTFHSHRLRDWVIVACVFSTCMLLTAAVAAHTSTNFMGTIAGIEQTLVTVRESSRNELVAVTVMPYTSITRNGRPVRLADLKPGEFVQVGAENEGRTLVAVTIAAGAVNVHDATRD